MNLIHKAYSAQAETLADKRQVKVICSTEQVDRAGEIVVNSGIDFAAYMATGAGPVLWNHNPNIVIAKCIEIGLSGNQLVATVQFPPAGEDPEADKYYNKIKFGSVPGVSIGFQPVEMEPLDKGNPKKGPQKYLSSELMEFSFTPTPANRGALVVERSNKGGENWKVGASRNLDIGSGDGGDVLSFADFDGDCPDTAFARKGFLAYDAGSPEDKGSYVLPFAKMVGGRMVVIPELVKAARADLEKTSLPDDVAEKARAVIDHYEGKMKQKTAPASVIKAGVKIEVKSLWHVAELARILGDLAWLEECIEWEALYSEEPATLPGVLGGALQTLGQALIDMTEAEVAALIAEEVSEEAGDVAKSACADGAPIFVKAFVATHIKAGRKFSATSISTMQEACKAIKEGHDAISSLMEESETSDTEGSEKAAEADRVKAIEAARAKRLREIEVLRLKKPV